jgi:hypothetical protein
MSAIGTKRTSLFALHSPLSGAKATLAMCQHSPHSGDRQSNGRSQGPVNHGLSVVDRTGLVRVRRERYCYEDLRSTAVRSM